MLVIEGKFEDSRRKAILADLGAGLTRNCAAERNGISDRTLRNWLRRGRAGEPGYREFLRAVRLAERDVEREAVASVLAAARGGQLVGRRTKRDKHGNAVTTETYAPPNWLAAAWWLERKFPESWGRHSEVLREILAAWRKRQREKAKGRRF